MTDDLGGSIERQLDIMIGQLQGISRRLDHADDSRAKLHERIDEMAEGVARVSGKVDTVEAKMESVAEKVAGMEPDIATFRGIKTKAAGVVFVLVMIGGGITWAFASVGPEVRKAIVWMFSSN